MAALNVVFDFDGVLIDSIDEVAVTAFNAAQEGPSKLVTMLSELPPGYHELFSRNRFYVQRAGDFIPFASWCRESCGEPSRTLTAEEYAELAAGPALPLQERTKHFFATRNRFVRQDKEAWLSLNRPFQPLWDELCRGLANPLRILTYKNRRAVLDLAQHFSLPVSDENVFSGDAGHTKSEQLERIQRTVPATENLLFIDDNIRNLLAIREDGPVIGVELALAQWGYCGEADRERARSEGISLLSQEELLEMMR